MLIAADSVQEHDIILKQVVDRAKQAGVKFNKNKIQFRVSSVKYLGYTFSEAGMQIDEDRIKAIKNLEEPKNRKQLQSVLGLVNYFRQFIPNLEETAAPLQELLKNNIVFTWFPNHQKAFDAIKTKIITAPVLSNFDSNKELTLQCDASQNSVGCCLLQESKPVSFSSRSLTESEKNFVQIDKELLGIVYATKKFHNFIYGRKITVITDHKPLVNLLNKNVSDIVSSRLQRMKIRLLKYELEVKYLPGKYMYVADLLSRSYLRNGDEEDKWVTEVVHTVSSSFNITGK